MVRNRLWRRELARLDENSVAEGAFQKRRKPGPSGRP